MTTPTRMAGPLSRRGAFLAAGGAVLVAALIASGRISTDEIILYLAIVASVIVAGTATSIVARWQSGTGSKGVVPGALSRVDPLGTLVIPALLVLSGIGYFGWLRPVPQVTGSFNNRNPFVVRSLVGPATSLVLMVGCAVVFRATVGDPMLGGWPWSARVAYLSGYMNLWLVVIALVPVPPLAGSVVLERLLPVGAWARYARIRPHLLAISVGIVVLTLMLHIGLTSALSSLLLGWWGALTGT